MSMTTEDLDAVCGMVHDLCGIYLDESKEYLIEGRIADLLPRHNCATYVELARKVRLGSTSEAAKDVVDAITTNETLWFRDNAPFEALRHKAFPELIDARSKSIFPKRLRVWSAACSTGQEVYSIAMSFADVIPDVENWDLKILGSDISPSAVKTAEQGVYSKLEMQRGMDQKHLSGYFTPNGDTSTINPALRKMCRFETRNLLKPFTMTEKFDVIFCRNVSIYFEQKDRNSLFLRLAEKLAPDGWLFTGSGESLGELGRNWKPQQHCRAICYRPNMEPLAYV